MGILFCALGLPGAPSGDLWAQVFENRSSPRVEIRNESLQVENNFGEPYEFALSVLGVRQGGSFLPLLAMALDPLVEGPEEWLAVWNLSSGRPGILQRAKALVPVPFWNPRSGNPSTPDYLPKAVMTTNGKRSGSKHHFAWRTARVLSDIGGLFAPARFVMRTYMDNRIDYLDRRFYQVYPLLLLYEEAAALHPDEGNASPAALSDLKYALLVNRKALGVLVRSGGNYSTVENFESHLRKQMGKVSSFLHTRANLYHLRFEEIPFALGSRIPIYRAGILSIREEDLPEEFPEWPRRNPFELRYNPYEHPEIQQQMKIAPDQNVPLAYYVLSSEFRIRPVIVADLFDPGNPARREMTASLRASFENFWSLQTIPFYYRLAKMFVGWSLNRKDVTYFSERSVAPGVESARLFARIGWHFDTDTNDYLLRSMEKRSVNPLTDSFTRQSINARTHYEILLADEKKELSRAVRRTFENRIRNTLGLGNRAIFRKDYEKFGKIRSVDRALKTIRTFTTEVHISGISWERVSKAWAVVAGSESARQLHESQEFLDKLTRMHPRSVPEEYRGEVFSWLQSEGSSGTRH